MSMHLLLRLTILALLIPTAGWARGFDPAHTQWGIILTRHVEHGRVDYPAIKKDSRPLHAYLDEIATVTEDDFSKFSVNERKALLINTYNAAVMALIVKHYPVLSIKEIGVKFIGPWKVRYIRLLGKSVSLDDIEHGMLRKMFADPRIHFALVSASKGAPKLYPTPFQAGLLDQQLDAAAFRFLNDSNANWLDIKNHTLYLSEMFRWFEDDFQRVYGSIWNLLRRYREDAKSIPPGRDFKLAYFPYDWSLNE